MLAGTLTGIAERRFKLRSDSTRKRSERALGAVLVTIVLLAGVGVVSATGNPYTRLSDSWTQFKRLDNEAAKGQSRFLTGGTNRYDFWVVAWDVFGEHPVRGVGADGFQPYYLRRGKSLERPRYAHSLELGVLAQTGLVGALLVFGAMAALAAAAVRAIRKGYAPVGAAAGAAASVFAYWFLHGSVDWFWEFAGLGGAGAGDARPGRRTGPARQVPATPSGPAPGHPPTTGPGRRGRRRRRHDRPACRPVDLRPGDRPGGGSVARLARGGVHAPGPRTPAQPPVRPARPGRGHDRAAPRTARPGRDARSAARASASPRTPTRCWNWA